MPSQFKKMFMACLREVGRNTARYGEMWFAPPEVFRDAPPGADPAADHPEKLCHDVPLSHVERALERQIRDLM